MWSPKRFRVHAARAQNPEASSPTHRARQFPIRCTTPCRSLNDGQLQVPSKGAHPVGRDHDGQVTAAFAKVPQTTCQVLLAHDAGGVSDEALGVFATHASDIASATSHPGPLQALLPYRRHPTPLAPAARPNPEPASDNPLHGVWSLNSTGRPWATNLHHRMAKILVRRGHQQARATAPKDAPSSWGGTVSRHARPPVPASTGPTAVADRHFVLGQAPPSSTPQPACPSGPPPAEASSAKWRFLTGECAPVQAMQSPLIAGQRKPSKTSARCAQ